MAIPKPAAVLSHWCTLLENFRTPPLEFYESVEKAVRRREVPDIEVTRVDWHEGGVFSDKREYLRITRGNHIFDICGAPFGTGFFVSSWLVRPRSAPWPIALAGLILGASLVFLLIAKVMGLLIAPLVFVVLFPFMFWLFVQIMNELRLGWDESIVAIPFLGPIYERIFCPETYFRIDTALMFQQAIHNSVMEVVDGITAGHGVRALSELERRPTLAGITANGK